MGSTKIFIAFCGMKISVILFSIGFSQLQDPERTENPTMKMALQLIKSRYPSKLIEKMLQNYGCHCFPGMSRIAGGMGPAVDDKDMACLKLTRCHKCIELDYEGQCDPYFSSYEFSIKNSTIVCENEDPCRQSLCECDKNFAEEIAGIWDDKQFNRFYWLNPRNVQSTGVFEFRDVCIAQESISVPDKCCGNGFRRKPYDSGVWTCCDSAGKLFDHGLQECCEDGRVVYFGSC